MRSRGGSLMAVAMAAALVAQIPNEKKGRRLGDESQEGLKGTPPNPNRMTKAQKKAEKRARRANPGQG